MTVLIQLLAGGAHLHAQVLGNISTVAGQCGQTGYINEPTQATANKLGNQIDGLAVDSAGNLYIADAQNNRIRRVDTAGVITTIAGNGGGNGFAGDGGSATSANIKMPEGIAVDPTTGTIYIADAGDNRVLRFTVGGNINTVVGGGTTAPSLTPIVPTSVTLNSPTALALDKPNNILYITNNNNQLLKWNMGANNISVVVGNLSMPTGVAVSNGVPYIVENGGQKVISKFESGIYSVVAGGGNTTIPPSGSSSVTATSAKLNSPINVAFDSSGYLYVTDKGSHQVYRINLTDNSIVAVAGNGQNNPKCSGDSGPALSAQIDNPSGLAISSSDRVYIGQDGDGVVRAMPRNPQLKSISVLSGSPQSATVNTTFAAPFVVVALVSNGTPAGAGYSVTFNGAGEILSTTTAITDSSGQAQTTVTASKTAGTYTVTASATGATSASGTFTNLAGPVSTLTFTAQPTGTTAGATITPPVLVQAVDVYGNPVSGITIAVSAQGGPGSLSGTLSAATNASGLATFSNLSIAKTGTYTLQATDGTHYASSASFVIRPAMTTIKVLSGDGQSTPLTQAYPGQLKVILNDSLGNAVPGVSVIFTAPSTGATVSFSGPSTVNTDSAGVAAVTVTAAVAAGSFQVIATAPSVTSSQAVFNLVNLSGSAQRLAFMQQPTNTAAGATISPPVTVQLKDSGGTNNVAMSGVPVALTLTGGATATASTDSTGLATFANLSIPTAGNYQYTATSSGLASVLSNPFMITAGGPSKIVTAGGTPQSTTVLGPFAAPLTVVVSDSANNPVSGVTVTFTAPSSGPSATLSAPSAKTDSSGSASVSAIANGVAGGPYNVTASASGVSPSATFALTNLAGVAANLVFSQQPANTTAGAIMAPVIVRVTDTAGNPVSGVTITLTAQGGSGVLSGATPVQTDATGLATFSNLSINLTGTYSLQATDGTRFATSNSFVISPGTAASITVVAGSGQSAPVGSFYASPLKASVQDALGNGIPGVSVTFNAPSVGPSVSFSGPVTVITDSTGVAEVSVIANGQVGSFQVTASAPGVPTPAVFSLSNVPGTASRLLFVQQPSNALAGAIITPPVTVQITDNVGNYIALPGVAVTLALNPVGGRLRAISGTTVATTDGSGLATFSNLSISTAGNYELTASAASLASTQSNIFTISAGPAASIKPVAGTPQSTTVLAPFAVPLQVLVTDSLSNPISGITVTFAAPGSGASATLSASTATTDASGHASVTTVANAIAGSYTVTASVSGVASSASFALTNLTGLEANLVFTQEPVNTPAGATMLPVVVRVTDNGGNPVSGVTIALTAQGGPGVLTGTIPIVTDASGLATFSNLSINKTGTYALQATDGTRFAISKSFTISPATSSSISAVAGNGQSTAITTNYLTPLKVSVQDTLANPIPGVAVTFTAPASGASVTFLGSTTVTTDGTGIAGIFVTANSQVGTVQITATAVGIAAPAIFTLNNIPGTASRLAFAQQPSNALAGAIITPTTVQITDNVGNSVAQAGVAVTLSLNPITGHLSGTTTAVTDANGLATFSDLSVSTAGSYQLTALGTSLASAQSAAFTISVGAAGTIQAIAGTPQSTTVLAPFAVPLQVLVTDSLGNPLSGVPATFAAPTSGASATLSASTATTDVNGRASVTAVANAAVGSYTVTASVSGVATPASFALTNLGGAGANLTFTQQPVNTPAGALMAPVVVRVTDNGGNPVSGVTITLTAQGGPGDLSGAIPIVTDASGLATFSNLSINKTGTYALQATDGTRFTTSNSFTISPATSPSISVVAGNGQSTAITTNYLTPLKVIVQDTLANAIPGVAVTFSAPTSGASVTFLGPATVTTDGTGIAGIFVTANSQVGSFQVTATASGIATPAIFTLTNIPGSASRLAFVQQPSNAAAGAVITPAITVQLTDSIGNSVTQAGVAVTLSLNPGTGGLVSVSGTTTVVTNASGLATFSGLSISTAGSYQFTALSASLASALSTAFTISVGSAAVIEEVAGTPQTTTVLAPFAVPLQVLVTDSLSNPLNGVSVTFAAPTSGASASLSASTVITDANGHASVTAVANAVVGSYMVTASVSGVSPPASFALTNVSGVGADLFFTQQPSNTAAGAIITPPVIVQVTDNGGNPISGVTISLTAQGGPGVLSGAAPVVTDASGLATFANLSIDKAGTYALQATDGTRYTISASFVLNPATASSITVAAGSGQSSAVGAPYATQLKARVQDILGNGVPGVSVIFAAPSSGASVSFSGPTTVTTDSAGLAAVSVTANTQVGAFQVTATASGIVTPATFSLTNIAGSASRLAFVQQPSNAAAGAVITPPITVQITDNVGNSVAQAGVAVTLSLNPITGHLSGTTTVVTDASGLATFSDLSVSTAGSYQLTALGTSLASAQSAAFTISVGAAGTVRAIAGTPQSTTVLAPFAVPLQVLVSDSLGNPLTGVSVTFTAPTSGASATLSASTATTDVNGHASVTAVANAAVGSYTVTASVSGVATPASFALTNVSGVGTNLIFAQQPVNTPAGAIMAPVLVLATDNGGNPVSGVTVALLALGGPGVLSGATPVVTNTSGLATFSNLSIDKGGTYALQATDGVHFALSASFVISSGTVSSITVVAGSGQSTAVGAPYASQLKASLQDPLGNGVPGASVTFAAPTSGASVVFSGPATVTTDSMGVATISVTANSQLGSFQVTATAPGTSAPAVFNLTNIPGSASRLAFVQQPSSALAGAVIAPPITVQVTDSIGNSVAVPGLAVTLTPNPVTGGLPAISGNTTVLTNPSGLATFAGLSISTAGSYQFTAVATSLASAQSSVFTISVGTAGTIQPIAGTPQSTIILAPFAVPLQVLVTDAFSNPLSGLSVTIAAPTSGASATLSASNVITGANGIASVTAVANAVVGSYMVTASVSGVSPPASFTLTNLSGVGANLIFTQQPSNAAAGAVITPPAVVRVTDNGGNPISGVTLSLSAQGGPGVLSGATPVVTDASGAATFSNLSIDKAGTYALQATDGTRFATSNSFVISPATASSITAMAGSGQSAAVGAPYASQLRASVQDLLGNGVPGVSVTFAAPSSGASVSFAGPTTVTTDSTGVAAISVTANTEVGPLQVTATAPSTPTPAVFVLTNITGSASRLNFVQQPKDAQAGVTITPAVTVQVTDNGGNSVAQADLTVTLSLNPLTGGLSAISGTTIATTDSNGLATFSRVSISTAGSYQLVANGQTVSSTQSNTFRILAGAAAAIASTGGTPQSATVLAPFAIPLQAVVTDSFGNPISGASVTFTAPASGASAALSASTVTTDANGRAGVTAVANALTGSYTVTASVSGVTSSATFALTNISSGATQLLTQPSHLEFLAVVGSNGAPAAVAPKTIQVTSANALVPINYQTTVQVQTPAGGTWLTVSPGNGVTPGSATVAVDPTGLQPGIFSGLVTFTPTDTTISPAYVLVTLVVGCGANGCPPPTPASFAVTNAASFYAGGSPAAAQTLFGNYLASSTHTASYPLPTSLGGTTVLVNGIAAPLYYVSPTQINFQMPSATPPGSVRVEVVTASGSSSSLTPLITAVQPGLYVSGDFRAKALNQDLTPHTPQTPIPAGGYVLLYMTGMGPTTPSVADGQPAPSSPPSSLSGTVRATVGGLPANVAFAGLAPGFAGLIQVNVQIPAGLTPGDQPAFVTIGGVPSNAGLITVK